MNDLQIRDGSCRVTGLYDYCEQAHLVPATERDWWDKNTAGTSGFANRVRQERVVGEGQRGAKTTLNCRNAWHADR
jgi:hypothetical protein